MTSYATRSLPAVSQQRFVESLLRRHSFLGMTRYKLENHSAMGLCKLKKIPKKLDRDAHPTPPTHKIHMYGIITTPKYQC